MDETFLIELARDPKLYGSINAQFRMFEMRWTDPPRVALMEEWCAQMFGVDPRVISPSLAIERWSRIGRRWYFRDEADALVFKMMWTT
jgi:hypothetical protein